MRTNKVRPLLILCLALCFFLLSCNNPTPTDLDFDEIDVSGDPVQVDFEGDTLERKLDRGYIKITPVARYEISAVVASKKYYSFGWSSLISPVDLALVWGKLAEQEYDRCMSYSQDNRWYYYRYKEGPLDLNNRFIINHSANLHILPANENVLLAVKSLKKKQKVFMEGYLVNVKGVYAGNEVWWHTSLRRSDTGQGSCEVFYVERVKIGSKIYD